MISKDRKTTVYMANVYEFNNVPLVNILKKSF